MRIEKGGAKAWTGPMPCIKMYRNMCARYCAYFIINNRGKSLIEKSLAIVFVLKLVVECRDDSILNRNAVKFRFTIVCNCCRLSCLMMLCSRWWTWLVLIRCSPVALRPVSVPVEAVERWVPVTVWICCRRAVSDRRRASLPATLSRRPRRSCLPSRPRAAFSTHQVNSSTFLVLV